MAREARPISTLIFQTRCADRQRSSDLHQQMRKMVRWAEGKFSDMTAAEHHISGDGFLATPLDYAAMIIGATETVRVSGCAILAPLYNPLHLAERLAFLDLISNGRFRAVLALGYREQEYRAAGVDWQRRGDIFDQLLAQVMGLLRGETVEINGQEAQLHHLPGSDPDELVYVGGNSKPGARRAARFNLPFWPAIESIDILDAYDQACANAGATPRLQPSQFGGFEFIAEDPDAAWREVGPYLLYDALAYQSIGNSQRRSSSEFSDSDIESLRASGTYSIITPEQALERFEERQSLTINPLAGGIPEDQAWRCLELYETRVLPHLDLDFRPFKQIPW